MKAKPIDTAKFLEKKLVEAKVDESTIDYCMILFADACAESYDAECSDIRDVFIYTEERALRAISKDCSESLAKLLKAIMD